MTNYKLGLYEKALPEDLDWEEKLALTRKSGFDWLELSIDESDKKLSRLDSKETIREIRTAISNTGVPIKTMCLSGHRRFPFGSHSAEIRENSMRIMHKALEVSCSLGIRLIQLAGYDVYYEESDAESRNLFLSGIEKAAALAAEHGVCMGFETMETPFMDTVEKGMRVVSKINSPYLGMYPDIGNLKNASILYGGNVVSDLSCGEGRIFAAHMKETRPGIYRDMFFGCGGHTEYLPCAKELLRQGVRMFTGEFWYHGEENYIERLEAASAFLRASISQAAEER